MIVRMGSKLIKMAHFFRSQNLSVLVIAFLILSIAYKVEGTPELKMVSVGDNIILSCYHDGVASDNYKRWYQNGTLIADWNGVHIDDPRYTQRNTYQFNGADYIDTNIVYISNITTYDSSIIKCANYHAVEIRSYDVRVIGCSRCILTTHINPNKIKVICFLDDYWAEQEYTNARVSLHSTNSPTYSYIYRYTLIIQNRFSFSVEKTLLKIINSAFKLYIDDNLDNGVTCTLPPQLPTPSTFSKAQETIQNVTTTSLNRPATTDRIPVNRPPSIFTTLYPSQNKNASLDKHTMYRNMTIIVAILGSVFILILFSIIIVIRRYKKRKVNKRNSSEVFYESVHDESPMREPATQEMVETNIDQQNADHPESVNMIDSQKSEGREENIKSHAYMHLIMDPAKQVDQKEITENYTSLVNYGNSMVQPPPNWKESGACPRQDDQYDDVMASEKGNDDIESYYSEMI